MLFGVYFSLKGKFVSGMCFHSMNLVRGKFKSGQYKVFSRLFGKQKVVADGFGFAGCCGGGFFGWGAVLLRFFAIAPLYILNCIEICRGAVPIDPL